MLDKAGHGCETALIIKTTEGTMNINRRELMLPALALGLLSVVPIGMLPAFAGADEDAIAKNLEAFRVAQVANNGEVLAALSAPDLSYSHSSGAIDDKTSLAANTNKANYK